MLGLISFIGLLVGILLAKLTKEEIRAGKKYFIILESLILFVIFISLTYSGFNFIGLVFGLVAGYFSRKIYFYFGLAIILTLASKNLNLFLTSLVFLFGLPYGTLLYKKGKTFLIKEIVLNLILFLIPLIFLIGDLIFNYNTLFSGFVAGALLINTTLAIKDGIFK